MPDIVNNSASEQPSNHQIELALLSFNRLLLSHWRSYDQQTPMGNISWNEYYYINALRDRPLNLSELAERVSVKKPSASAMVSKLEKRGMVSRRIGDIDRREVQVQLTAAAREQLDLEWLVYHSFLQDLEKHLEPDDYRQFARLLIAIAERLPGVSAPPTTSGNGRSIP